MSRAIYHILVSRILVRIHISTYKVGGAKHADQIFSENLWLYSDLLYSSKTETLAWKWESLCNFCFKEWLHSIWWITNWECLIGVYLFIGMKYYITITPFQNATLFYTSNTYDTFALLAQFKHCAFLHTNILANLVIAFFPYLAGYFLTFVVFFSAQRHQICI